MNKWVFMNIGFEELSRLSSRNSSDCNGLNPPHREIPALGSKG